MKARMESNNTNNNHSRIEKKRAHDREAQRASRAKTKAYIAHLERTVTDLSQNSGDNRANYLARHVSKQAQEMESMQALVNRIRLLVQEAPNPDQKLSAIGSIVDEDDPDASAVDSALRGIFPNHAGDAEKDSHLAEHSRHHPSNPATTFPPGLLALNPSGGVPDHMAPTCATAKMAAFGDTLTCDEKDPHYFRRLDNALGYVERTAQNLSDREEDEDILIRAIVHGWHAAEQVHHLDVAWRLFREADETLWHRIRPIDRLAHFWQMRSTMLNKIQPKNQERRETPTFMSPTYVQRSQPNHPVVADYFAWPHVRDNLIATGVDQVSGRQTIAFADSFRFIWPYELRDMYKKNTTTGFYSFSEGFKQNFNNLACYRILQSGHPTDIPTRLIPQISWDDGSRIVECKSPEEQQSDSSPEALPVNKVMTNNIPDLPIVSAEPSLDWLSSLRMDVNSDPRFMGFPMDPLQMAHESALSQWPDT